MRILSTLAVAAGLCLMGGAANAQATRTWISGVGDDVNPCSRTAPCKTFPGAISKTAAGGEIDTLDPGGFGAVTVTKAITLANEGVGEAGLLVAGTNAITVNCVSDPACHVVVRGLVLDGGPLGSNSLNGIRFIAGGSLIVENCTIRNFTGGDPNGSGIQFAPNTNAFLSIDHSQIVNNGSTSSTSQAAGVLVLPSNGATATVSITNTQIDNNVRGVWLDGTAGSVLAVLADDDISNNSHLGVAAVSTSTPVKVNINRSIIAFNLNEGIKANGAMTTVRIGNSNIEGNGQALLNNGATASSYGTNAISGNTNAGDAFTVVGPT